MVLRLEFSNRFKAIVRLELIVLEPIAIDCKGASLQPNHHRNIFISAS